MDQPWNPDVTAGGQSGLQLLYDLVPAAEEQDILEEVWREEDLLRWQRVAAELAYVFDDESAPEQAPPTDSAHGNEVLLDWLTHTLGATVIKRYGPTDS